MLAPFPSAVNAAAQDAPQATPVAPEDIVTGIPPATEPAPAVVAPDLPTPVVDKARPTLSLAVAPNALVDAPVLASASLLNADRPTGQVTYLIFWGEGCAGDVHVQRIVDVNARTGLVPSAVVTFAEAGLVAWQAIYSGDATNHGVVSNCMTQRVEAPTSLTLKVTRGDTVAFGVLSGPATATTADSDTGQTYVMSDAVTVEVAGGTEPWVVTCSTDGGGNGVELSWQLAGTSSWTPFADGPCFVAVDGGNRTLTFHYRLRVDPSADPGHFAFDVTYEVSPLVLW